jgi:hypothetical protein
MLPAMPALAYSVIATLPDEQTALEYIGWLQAGHTDRVVEAGALSASIVRMTEPAEPPQVETRYLFASREAFERYVRTAAPMLRAEGLEKFPPARGVRFQRREGIVIQ